MKTITIFLILASACGLVMPHAQAAGSKPKKPTNRSVELYNEAWKEIQELDFTTAEQLLRKSLRENSKFAEAHNNLAYVLRKQGDKYFEDALRHYNRAIELKPKLAEAYMYRGVLHVQMGDKTSALANHNTLLKLDRELAEELEWVIKNGREKAPEQFFGVAAKVKK